jgi:hypothetical protein
MVKENESVYFMTLNRIYMNLKAILHAIIFSIVLTCSAEASWSFEDDYSMTNNPIGSWSYGRTWTINATDFDLMTVRWDSGWYMGNYGNGSPSLGDWHAIWAKNNSNGYPVVRWTCPESGVYDIIGDFVGSDSRGVDNLVYVAIEGDIYYSDHVNSYQMEKDFGIDNIYLDKGDTVNFLMKWNGGVYSEYGWTSLAAHITVVPEPSSFCFLVLGGIVLIRPRRTIVL